MRDYQEEAINKARQVVFKGEHEFFVEGEIYTYRNYAEYTVQNAPPGVKLSTIKSRLDKQPFCLPHHLLSVADYIALSQENNKNPGYSKEAREKARTASRLENHDEVLSQKWLSISL